MFFKNIFKFKGRRRNCFLLSYLPRVSNHISVQIAWKRTLYLRTHSFASQNINSVFPYHHKSKYFSTLIWRYAIVISNIRVRIRFLVIQKSCQCCSYIRTCNKVQYLLNKLNRDVNKCVGSLYDRLGNINSACMHILIANIDRDPVM